MQGVRRELPDYPVYAKINGTEKSVHGLRTPEAVKIAGMLENDGVSAIEVSSCTFNENLGPDRGSVPVDMIPATYPGIKDLPGFVKKVMPPIIRKLKAPDDPQYLYNVPAAKAIRQSVNIPVIVCGGIRSKADMEKVIETEHIDAVSISRPLILEADLVNRYKTGKATEPKCIECNYCLMGILENPLRCYYGKVPMK
jgi:2,4-dienoyl-CoA reductase-like NADH-dependent reductase (Old Yellow Enzyme family)